MTAQRMLPPMDVNQYNDEHPIQYRLSKKKFPDEHSNDEFELFVCMYNPDHKVNSKNWRKHLKKCQANYNGDGFVKCRFNPSHHVPAPEAEWHEIECPDKYQIIEACTKSSQRQLATRVNHNAVSVEFDGDEDWNEEIDDAPAPDFQLDTRMGMPLNLQITTVEQNEENEANFEHQYDIDDCNSQESSEEKVSVLLQELLPEHHKNWNNMTKNQKKNYKRRYNQQQQRMKEEGVTEEDFANLAEKERDPETWSETRRNHRLLAIKSMFPVAADKQHAIRFDYTSQLNIVCQKCRINLPEFLECNAGYNGGFAFKCRVGQKWYYGKDFCTTKKDAKHECAKWALLGMEIPGIDTEDSRETNRPKQIHPQHTETLRQGDEIVRLIKAGAYFPEKPALRLPQTALRSPVKPPQQQRQQSHYQQQIQQQQEPTQTNEWEQQKTQKNHWQQQQLPGSKQYNGFDIAVDTQKMNLGNNDDFPSLGGENSWSTVKKKPSGVQNSMGKGRGRGRGRSTTMKL